MQSLRCLQYQTKLINHNNKKRQANEKINKIRAKEEDEEEEEEVLCESEVKDEPPACTLDTGDSGVLETPPSNHHTPTPTTTMRNDCEEINGDKQWIVKEILNDEIVWRNDMIHNEVVRSDIEP